MDNGGNKRLVSRSVISQSFSTEDTRDDDDEETMGNAGESEKIRERRGCGLPRLCTGSLAVIPSTAEALPPVLGRGESMGQPIRRG